MFTIKKIWRSLWHSYGIRLFCIFLIALCLPLYVLGRLSVQTIRQSAEATALSESRLQSQSLAQAMDNMLDSSRQIGKGLALTLHPLAGRQWESETLLVGFRLASPLIQHYALVDSTGHEWASSDARLTKSDWPALPLWKEIQAEDGQRFWVHVGDDRSPYVYLSTPAPPPPGKKGRILICRINLIGLWRMAENLSINQSGQAELYTDECFAIVSEDQKAVVTGKAITDPILRKLLTAGKGSSIRSGPEFLACSRVKALDLTLLLRKQAEKVFAGADRVARGWQMVLLISFCLAVLISLLLQRFLSRPMRQLSDRARLIAEGQLEIQPLPSKSGEVGVLFQDFNEMVLRLQEAKELEQRATLGEAVERIAHDLGTPLTALKSLVSLLAKKQDDSVVLGEFLRIVPAEINRLERLLAEIREYSQVQQYSFAPECVGDIINDLTSFYGVLAGKRGITFQIGLPAENTIWDLDKDKIVRVLTNLINNALYSLDEGGIIQVRAEVIIGDQEMQRKLHLTIEDDGHGVPEEIAPRLFRPFATRREGGLGLGLAISRSITLAHGGNIHHEVVEPHGARFIIVLPESRE